MQTKIGETLGRYRLDALLGSGGMAQVFTATDGQLHRTVAVKVVLPAFAQDPQFHQRFLQEARLVAALHHPHILPIYDFGEKDGVPFLVMPLVSGGTLADRIGRPLPVPAVVAWVREVAGALDAAHAAGVLHRDVKPSNVLLDGDERALLADFGIARAVDSSVRLTTTGTVVGTPGYMAPELAQGESATPATDLYALAVLAWEMLAGRAPFVGENALAVLHQHVTRQVPAISEQVPELPAELDGFFTRALAKEPGQRPDSGAVLAAELAAHLAPTGPTTPATPTSQPTLIHSQGPPATTPSSAMTVLTPATSRGRLGRKLLGAATLVILGAVLATFGLRQLSGPGGEAGLPPEPTAEGRPGPAAEPPAGSGEGAGGAGKAEAAADGGAGGEARTSAGPEPPATARDEPEASPGLASPSPPPEPHPPATSAGEPSAGEGPAGGSRAGRRPLLGPNRPRGSNLGTGDKFAQVMEIVRPRGPATARYFEVIAARAGQILERRPGDALALSLAAYARAGQAYLRGDDAGARQALSAAAELGELPPLLLATSSLWVIREHPAGEDLAPWELAVLFGDARGEGMAAVDALLAERPEDARGLFARAHLDRLHGRIGAALEDAEKAHARAAAPSSLAPAVAHFLAETLSGEKRWAEALPWYREAVAGAGPEARLIAFEAGRIAADVVGDQEAATAFFKVACRAGNPLACRRAQGRR